MVKDDVFTDGDVLTRAKNWQEGKKLTVRLKHLQHEQESAEDFIKKERKSLLETRRTTRLSSGRSPVVGDLRKRDKSRQPPPLILSSHFRKPWSFSFTETSFNAVYNDDFDPYTCRRASRQSARSGKTRKGCKSAPAGPKHRNRFLVPHRPVTAYRQNNVHPSPTVSEPSSGPHQESRRESVSTQSAFLEEDTDYNYTHSDSFYGYGLGVHEPKLVTMMDRMNVSTDGVHPGRNMAWEDLDDSYSFLNDNSAKPNSSMEVKMRRASECSSRGLSTSVHTPDKNEAKYILEDDNEDESEIEDTDYILFKGKKIHNYVKPEDRYKRDLFKEVRREKLIRKLSLENPVKLHGYREENFKIHCTISRVARESALRRMVEKNRMQLAERRKPVVNNEDLQRRVKEFCQNSHV